MQVFVSQVMSGEGVIAKMILSGLLAVVLSGLLVACSSSAPGDADVSQAVTAWLKNRYAVATGPGSAEFAASMGLVDGAHLPPAECHVASKLTKHGDAVYTGDVVCTNAAIDDGKPMRSEETFTRVGDKWSVTEYHALP